MTLDGDRERIASLLPGYEIGDEIGRGGWGLVIGARHRQLDRMVAIKQLPPNLSADAAVRARFLAEARVLAALDHPHIVPVYDFVEADGLCLLVMEQLSGGTVWTRFTESGLSMQAACAVVLAACSGLHCAHQRGILHRDVKPENLLFSSGRGLKITDFGIARVLGGSETVATRAGEVLGTPAYMSPEQARGGELGPYTDVYAAGTVLYELLSGRLPFSDDGDSLSVLYRHVYDPPVPLRDVAPPVPDGVAEVVMSACASRPEDRPPTAEAFGVALGRAAGAAWGPGWLEGRGEVVVMGSTEILSALGQTVAANGVRRRAAVTADRATLVRPGPQARVHQPRAVEAAAMRELVPVRQMVAARSRVVPQFAAALVLLVVAIGVAFLGLGSGGGSLSGVSALTVMSVNPVGAGRVTLDLGSPVGLNATLSARTTADTARLGFSVAGVSLGQVSAPLQVDGSGSVTASWDATNQRYLVPSGATATVSLLRDGTSVGGATFPVRTAQAAWLTAPGAAAVVLALFGIAYLESLLRSLRRGRRRLTAFPGLAVMGGLVGVAISLATWLTTGRTLGIAVVVVCGVLGGASAVAAGLGAERLGRRRRGAVRLVRAA